MGHVHSYSIINSQLQSARDMQRTVLPLCATSCHFPSQHLSLGAAVASGWRLQTEQTQPCECVIRIVNEVNRDAHLTSLYSRAVYDIIVPCAVI